ncbi:MAG: hypothetical protein SGPRY_007501, partial [Prymnesium sp.]
LNIDFHPEAILKAGFICFFLIREATHLHKGGLAAALVSSAVKTLCHMRKMHRDRDYPMCPYKLSLSRVLVDVLLATTPSYLTKLDLFECTSRAGASLRAIVAMLAQAGFRKGERPPSSPPGQSAAPTASLVLPSPEPFAVGFTLLYPCRRRVFPLPRAGGLHCTHSLPKYG